MTAIASFSTPNRIIRTAMRESGLLQRGSDPMPEDYAEFLPRLLDLVNLWQTQGLKLWLNSDLPITLTAGTALYTLGPSGTVVMTKPLRVISAYYADANLISRPLNPLSWDEYKRLSTPTQPGPLNSYFVDKQQLTLNVSFWLVPDADAATGTAHLIIQQQAANPTMLNENVGFPIEWFTALYWGLADQICGGQPQAIMDRCKGKADEYRTALEDWDVEDDSTMFQPDPQILYQQSQFR